MAAQYKGTKKEFHKYIGPSLCNLVNKITRKYKSGFPACQHCKNRKKLQAAHVHGKSRKDIIDIVLNEFKHADTVDLEFFEKRFIKEHYPLKKSILALCEDCHRKYDKKTPKSAKENIASGQKSVSTAKEKLEIKKVKRRLQLWARPERQNNINSRILNAFLELKTTGNGCITREDIQTKLPDMEKFESNFNQMKIIAENNHGKIFEQQGDCIEIWGPVRKFVDKYEKDIQG